jgi:glutaredoxin-like protein
MQTSGGSKMIVVYGTTWCSDCKRSMQFLDEQQIPYRWIDIDRDAEAKVYVEKVNEGKRSVPTIVFTDGGILVEPSNDELAEKLGLSVSSNE